ncbi:NAD-dependent epimerase/dehydratase family protein [Amycolatopsis sp. FDAARGOS 1241]|uniref:NAD-dependent epimerase/dehydratase family protein n=1 Tax=Amycolatopsis sp. FDAARGOS 1241 TaxID=2778070 RepID=UPI00194E0CDD|nr:NAD-dependent epimerase/dehydratase family protein [Amycolatopsis sp. FDAARGOS 1241]QRP43125.1 NAD-dependent epimerase/dehydratase family protein [Amycolatopsis sp. FDAARGOS 1241]
MTVLVAGASGLVGAACVTAFAEAGWHVLAVSRRAPEAGVAFEHVPLDLTDAAAVSAAAPRFADVTHLVYTAVFEKPGLVRGWRDQDQMRTNDRMLRALTAALAGAPLEHATLLQGTKAYGVHRHPIRIPAREREPRDDHENFYWLQEDHLRAVAAERGFGWTILRPQLVVGPTHGVAMNLPPVIGAYAAICRAEGLPFGFPGGAPYVSEAVDVRLVADAALWAATAPAARDEHFNLTNGEVFAWRDLWPALAEELGVEPAPDTPLRLAEFLPAHSGTWDRVVASHGLRPTPLPALLGESHHYADFHFAAGAGTPPPPAFVSTVKIHQAGFTETWDTEESFRHWFRILRDRRILPVH